MPAQANANLDPDNGFATGAPSTFQIGEVDPSVKANGTQVPLNDLVIVNGTIDTVDGLNQRVYMVRHTSGSDTRALSLETPQDINLGRNCLFKVSSLQLIDVNGDAINDMVYASDPCVEVALPDTKFFGNLSNAQVFGVAGTGTAGGDFFTGGPVNLCGQEGGSLPTPTQFFGDISQPVIATAQFRNGSGKQDIAFYDSIDEDFLRVLENDGTLGLLTAVDNPIQGFDPDLNNTGSSIVAGDFNGDGNQDVALIFQGDDAINNRLRVFLGDGAGNFSASPAA
ncbi:MAG: hypothetical protein K8R69_00160, partial [Deltaproteobacteria bacterium]|nr:hypothetical protein [Deltaproteobacteria bacterium]